MNNILEYLNDHKLIIIALGIGLVISLVLIVTLGNKLGNEAKVVENLTCSALNDVKTIIPEIAWSETTLIITNSGDLYTLSEKNIVMEQIVKELMAI